MEKDLFEYEGRKYIIEYCSYQGLKSVVVNDDVKDSAKKYKVYLSLHIYDLDGLNMFDRIFPNLNDVICHKLSEYLKENE